MSFPPTSAPKDKGNKRPAAELSDEDDDADLYGSDADEEENAETPTKKRKASTSGQTGSESLGLGAENPPTQIPTYLFVTSAVGTLSAYDVATGVECFRVPNFCDGPEILADSYTGMDMDEDTDAATEKSTETKSSAHAKANGPIVVEIKLVALGKRKELLHLLAITSAGDLNVYRAFQCVPPTRGDRTKPMYKQRGASCLGGGGNEILRFAKLDHEVILRPMDNVEDDWAFGPAPTGDTTKVDESTAPESTDLVGTNVAGAEAACSRWLTSVREHRKQIFPFFNISTYNGVVITGEHTRPWWLIATRKGLRTHPMYVDTGAIYFTPFHNVNCSHGFMYFNNERELRICQLPQHLLYDSAWPSRKVPIRATPHHIAYHVESKQYVIAKSVDEEVLEVARLTNDTKDRQPEKFEGGVFGLE
ncbi:hypothetical protein SARC_03103 [Sphaeroforma arctica JP610]|uniref:RSE1/DDB1/CPSF1 second beta-propeller domain-containing protein n=1 Tax=Sphaeroforma arctica JP610 TaxID=667725 RepID=A0A0L0G8Y2_9EUKA|nr:hypothetical protein SARC_03103 [Sphaeroforma arctica JP610]KNC84698.1 hypothetical protein SARC_03103 [Sphaeroforma arctica JP610]|eukprot:XP_014158600.1 hypothetical protein SARC_03103 [Sphaeroforma arctica JP610]